jgi:uracil-DNA glycosylase family 4
MESIRRKKMPIPWQALNRHIISCHRCPRLREYCGKIAREKRRAFADWKYWGRPVPNFGDPAARLLIVGLAPAAHGGNRTGRVFTGDRSGDWLFKALHKAGFANQPHSTATDDGLVLTDCAITAAVHCAPPDNKPLPQEMDHCREWLVATFDMIQPRGIIALGQIAFRASLVQAKRLNWWQGAMPQFGHDSVVHFSENRWLIASYHPSQQNTFTGKLTEAMFDRVFRRARNLLSNELPRPA